MKQKKKNKFFTFMFSLLPGAAEMYMGFMKNGLSLMLLFFLSFTPMLFFRVLEFLMSLSAVLWFYGFFHARNYAGMDDQEFYGMEDKYIWEEFADFKWLRMPDKSVRKWVAGILILIGAAQLWDYFSDIIYRLIPENWWEDFYPIVSNLPQAIVSILFIVIGIRMIAGKKKELYITSESEVKPVTEIPQIQDKSLDSKEA